MEYIATSVLGIVFLVVAERMRRKRAMLRSEKQMLGAKITIILTGAWVGGVILFFGGGLLIGLMGKSLRIYFFSFDFWIVTSFTTGSIIGGLIGYLIYKRSRYSKISYYEPF